MGTNIWCANPTQEVVAPCTMVPEPAMFNLEKVNRLAECQCPYESSSHVHHVLREYEHSAQPTNKSDEDTNLTLHLRLESLNINVDIPDENRIHSPNSTNNFCQIPNKQPQIDCTTPTFQ